MFRLRASNGEWLIGHNGVEDVTTKDKSKALILPDEKRKFWEEEQEEFEIVSLAEDELTARFGAPRLPGF